MLLQQYSNDWNLKKVDIDLLGRGECFIFHNLKKGISIKWSKGATLIDTINFDISSFLCLQFQTLTLLLIYSLFIFKIIGPGKSSSLLLL